MKKHTIREDKTCLNCGSFVSERYCPKCGQENRDSRESFFHLIAEFIADFVHYDSSFWKTTRYLLFSPAKLSLEYISGKRKSYVNPVKLYIFISFITFFLPVILPSGSSSPTPSNNTQNTKNLSDVDKNSNKTEDTKNIPFDLEADIPLYGKVSSVKQLDSIHNSKPERERISKTEFDIFKRLLLSKENKHLAPDSTNYFIKKFESDSLTKYGKIRSLTQLDSIHKSKPKEDRLSRKEYKALKKYFVMNDSTDDDIEYDPIQNPVDFSIGIFKGAMDKEHFDVKGYGKVRSANHLDSIHNHKASHEKLSFPNYMKYKSAFNMKENILDEHKKEKMVEFMIHNLSKVLFVYMPIFAFWMWIFNLNRRKYYFDSGIFTLHFFSFWLLLISILMIINSILSTWLKPIEWIFGYIVTIAILYITFYFFRGNRTFYYEKRAVANIKGIFLIVINTIFIVIISVAFLLLAIARSY